MCQGTVPAAAATPSGAAGTECQGPVATASPGAVGGPVARCRPRRVPCRHGPARRRRRPLAQRLPCPVLTPIEAEAVANVAAASGYVTASAGGSELEEAAKEHASSSLSAPGPHPALVLLPEAQGHESVPELETAPAPVEALVSVPLAGEPLPQTPRRRSVRFDLEAATTHEVVPYAEVYGVHPREFVFGRRFYMIPATCSNRPGAGVAASSEDSDSSDNDSEEEWVVCPSAAAASEPELA
mmetsp:Transcript_16822/g.37978  ORF Transcript_16822/g.37978 Transcript_16822/m.37978 type:complete len:241 (-) Transcript_16822:134-856(-)